MRYKRGKLITSLTPLTLKGGVVRVIDSATGDIARTTGGFLEDEKYGVYAIPKNTAMSAEFDTEVTLTGSKTLKLSTTDVTGRAFAVLGNNREPSVTEPVPTVFKYQFPVKPSTSYRLRCYAKTTNAVAVQTYLTTAEYNDAGTRTASDVIITNKIGGTNDWTLLTGTASTNAATTHICITIRLNTAAGNISDAWFDVNSMTLEVVSTITNPSSVSANLYPKVTAVTSKDNIDQSQVTVTGAIAFGRATTNLNAAQSFLPTKKNLTGIVLQRNADTGTYAGNVTITLQADSAGSPSGTALATASYTSAEWEAITAATDFTASLPFTLTVDGSTKYWIVFTSSTQDNSNYTGVKAQTSGSYTNGAHKNWNGSAWSADTGYDLYFKTLYSKNTTNATIRTDTATMSITAPTTDGWAEGTVIDTATLGIAPLVLAPGVNNIYYSSNGPATADGTVDPSLQCIITPYLYERVPAFGGRLFSLKCPNFSLKCPNF